MNATGYAEAFHAEGARLTAIAVDSEGGDSLRRTVPSCPDWDLEALIEHCAWIWTLVHRSISADAPADRSAISRPTGPVSRWHAEAFGALVDLLAARSPDERVWTWDPEHQSMSFWRRRMAHEATMHRWDAESALGLIPAPIEAELAVDGIDELFDVYVRLRKPDVFTGDGETVHLHATDAKGEWVITRTPSGMRVERAHAKSDEAARGSAQDLLLFVWGRIGPDRLETFGGGELLDEFQRVVRF